MATSQRSGKNNSGEYIFKKDAKGNEIDETGKPITESGRSAAIDHDLDEIAQAFVKWGLEQGFDFLKKE
jgi:type I restriction enzyme M protein